MHERIPPLYPAVPDHIPGGLSVGEPAGDTVGGSEHATKPAPGAESSKKEKEIALEFTGFLGTDIRFGETSQGAPIAWFKFGVKNEHGRTQWYPGVAMNKHAERLRDKFQNGDPVTVRGYMQPYTKTMENGESITFDRLYAVHVRNLRPKKTGKTT
jgi:hypothetical protein